MDYRYLRSSARGVRRCLVAWCAPLMFVCTRCRREVPNPYEQYSERLEYLRRDGNKRPASFTLRLVCGTCVDTLAALRHRNALTVEVHERTVAHAENVGML